MTNLGDLQGTSVQHAVGQHPRSLYGTSAFMLERPFLSADSASGSSSANFVMADSHGDHTDDYPSPHNNNDDEDNEQGPQQQSKRKLLGGGNRVGRWSLDEKILFLYGLREFGKGRWKRMSIYLPDRSLVQIKSHAQKVLKRLDAGENIFRRLEENGGRLHLLLNQAHERLGLDVVQPPRPPPMPATTATMTPTSTTSTIAGAGAAATSTTTTTTNFNTAASTWSDSAAFRTRRCNDYGTDAVPLQEQAIVVGQRPVPTAPQSKDHDILAASALCQLAGPAQQEVWTVAPLVPPPPPPSPQQHERQPSSSSPPVIVQIDE